MRTILAISMGAWGKGKTVADAMKQLRKAGGTTARGRFLLQSAPADATVNDYGSTCWTGDDEPPYYIDQAGNRLANQNDPTRNSVKENAAVTV